MAEPDISFSPKRRHGLLPAPQSWHILRSSATTAHVAGLSSWLRNKVTRNKVIVVHGRMAHTKRCIYAIQEAFIPLNENHGV